MSSLVVDASVAVKWLIPEEFYENSQRIQQSGDQLIVPGHWRGEVANALWKKLLVRQDISKLAFDSGIRIVLAFRIASVPIDELLPAAIEIAVTHSRTVYDSLYVALAVREQCEFVTADLRLYNALKDGLPGTVRWIGDF